jgi:hypothetical protein
MYVACTLPENSEKGNISHLDLWGQKFPIATRQTGRKSLNNIFDEDKNNDPKQNESHQYTQE